MKAYLVSFYIKGLMAIVERWLDNDCREEIPEIIAIIDMCMGEVKKK